MAAEDFVSEARRIGHRFNAAGIEAYDLASIKEAERQVSDAIRELRDVKRRCNDEQRQLSSRNSARNSLLGNRRRGFAGALNQLGQAAGRAQVEAYRQAKSQIDGFISQLQGQKSRLQGMKTALKSKE